MRIVLLLIAAVPAFMAFRTLGLLRDWLILRAWMRRASGGARAAIPYLTEPFDLDAGPEPPEVYALWRFLLSALTTAAACCFALAACLTLLALARP